MPFMGFHSKFPDYEVITPQTHLSFTVRSLTVQEEEKLKGSMMTPSKITEHLNRCIYESIVQKPEVVTDYKTFLKNVSMKDRDCLLYGLYHITYDEIRNYEVRCSNCRKEYQVTVQASSTFNYNSYPGEDIFSKRCEIALPVTKGVKVIIRQPSLEDEEHAIRTLTSSPGLTVEIIFETLIIENISEDTDQGVISFTDRVDIIDAYRSLPARDKRVIFEKYNEMFGSYGIELKMKSFCSHCGNEEIVNLDLVENFFRMVHSA